MRTVVIHPQPSATSTKDMKVGEIALIDASEKRWGGQILLRTYSGFVSLNEPNSTWDTGPSPNFKALILTSGTQVILEVE